MSRKYRLVSYGEAMVRLAPIDPPSGNSTAPSAAATYLRTVGGDELNVCVDLALLGRQTEWISVLPTGPLGNVVRDSGLNAGVDLSRTLYVENAEVGTFFVIPEAKAVHYQRANSAWARQPLGCFDWTKIFDRPDIWVHLTGISPLTSETARTNWQMAMETALALGKPVTVDLNHRKALGTLQYLWSIVLPYLPKVKLLILSLDQLQGLAALEGIPYNAVALDSSEADQSWATLLQQLFVKLRGPPLACCFKARNGLGVQRRWTVIVDGSGVHSTYATPVYHRPKDECGGGSAWAAGYIDYMMQSLESSESSYSPVKAARRGDLLAALCQEIVGDHSNTTRSQLDAAESRYAGEPALVNVKPDETVNLGPNTPVKPTGHQLRGAQELIDEALLRIKEAKVLAILRANDAELAIRRGLELYSMGCRAMEVTLDSQDAYRILRTLTSQIPPERCVIGVGTVFEPAQVHGAFKNGARFALSPINPPGFIDACNELGVVAIPSGFSPQEIWNTKLQGAPCVKLFPAQMCSPATLKDILSIGQLGTLRIMPSGGITMENMPLWLAAGAYGVGMGSKLVGADIRCGNDPVAQAKATEEWNTSGRAAVDAFFKKIYS